MSDLDPDVTYHTPSDTAPPETPASSHPDDIRRFNIRDTLYKTFSWVEVGSDLVVLVVMGGIGLASLIFLCS